MNHVEEVNGIVGLAPRGPYVWGGGADDHRSIRIYAGKASESAWLRRPANAMSVWVGDFPLQYRYDFVEGHDVWIFLDGFIKREDVTAISNACEDAGAERIVVVRSDDIIDASWREEHDYL
mgnify:FL=1|jgi:hypothetical protein|tara:strand:- start:705 stop:1067 length:363 start_codon:yes stop_codon:yes gene_type:complete